jgi:hypothetical protein
MFPEILISDSDASMVAVGSLFEVVFVGFRAVSSDLKKYR